MMFLATCELRLRGVLLKVHLPKMNTLWRAHHVSPNPQFLPWTVKSFKPYWSKTHQILEFLDLSNAEIPQDIIDFCTKIHGFKLDPG